MQAVERSELRLPHGRIALHVLFAFACFAGASRDEARAEASGESVPSSEAIALSAVQVRHWSVGNDRWLALEGKVHVSRGLDSFQADRAVARIYTSDVSGRPTRKVDVVAEGFGDPSKLRPKASTSRRWSGTTTGDVQLSASDDAKLIPLDAEPADWPLVAQAKAVWFPPKPTLPAPPGPLDSQVKQAGDAPEPTPKVPAARLLKDAYKVDAKSVDKPVRLRDPRYKQVQFIEGPGFPDRSNPAPLTASPPEDQQAPANPFNNGARPSLAPPIEDGNALEPPPVTPQPNAPPPMLTAPGLPELNPPADEPLSPLPGSAGRGTPERPREPVGPTTPILPGSRRTTSVYLKSGPNVTLQLLPLTADQTSVTVIKGGVNIVTNAPNLGTIDIEADEVVIWRKKVPGAAPARMGENGEVVENVTDPMEVYLQGHVIVRQDRREIEGNADQAVYRANRAYYDYRTDRFLGLEAEVEIYAPGLIAPLRLSTPRADYFHPLSMTPGGAALADLPEIRAMRATTTGSRFANPGYRFNSRTLDMKKIFSDNVDSNTGTNTGPPGVEAKQTTWRIDSRQNLFFMGPVPVFYWPRFVADADDLDPPLRQFAFRTNNYFGQQLLTDFNGFKVFGIRKPAAIDTWNLDIDYLSYRGFGLGSEIGWYGSDLWRDLVDPYHKQKTFTPGLLTGYAGYVDMWGIKDKGLDVLGGGPAIVTANPAAGKHGYQRTSVPSFQDYRGRINFRHMQSLLPATADPFEDFRINTEFGYLSDRQFEEQYYKRLFDVGLDHETLIYGIRQKENWAVTALAEVNLMPFNTETQWGPKLDYYRFGDSFLGNRINYFGHSGVDYASTHTANEVNNKNIFAYIPYDPISNTSNTFTSGRAYTAHEIEMPINLDVVRFTPYLQGQAVGWSNQLAGQAVGRYWGGAGMKADFMAWKAYPKVESELMNVHGLNHKINFVADARATSSNVALNRLGVQDDLDDNTYEFVRRYFALTGYAGGLLPRQYDPRFLLLRRGISPITGSTDVQASIETIQMGIHQRLQTKRGAEGKRRIIDYIIFDLDTTYFPYASRDNFNKPFGQNTYNFEWYLGDRTSIVSTGWFEFFTIGGTPLNKTDSNNHNNPFGLNVITTGLNINRPPLGSVFIGYSVINTGPINTSALIASTSYWLSPKWYTSYGTTYDFGNALLLGANFSVTRIGKDYLTSVGLNVDPQRHSYQFGFEIAPRLSPSLRLGSGVGLQRLDTRYAPVQ